MLLLPLAASQRPTEIIRISEHSDIVDHELLTEAYILMKTFYSQAVPELVSEYPASLILIDDEDVGYFGCYGMLCFINDTEIRVYYTNLSLARVNPVILNLALIKTKENVDFRKAVILVLAHELGHHALTLSKIDIDYHHPRMYCGPDLKIEEALGIEWHIAWRCITANAGDNE